MDLSDTPNPQAQLLQFLQFLKNQPHGFIYNDPTNNNYVAPQAQPSSPPPQDQENSKKLACLKARCLNCQGCQLATQGRTQVVFGDGNPSAALMFVGEGPGRDEDAQGRPFVGRAGQLLTKIIQAMGMTREDIYISNVVKCRPPGNRTPLPIESNVCTNLILFKEIEIIKPKIICALGASALQALLGEEARITKLRGIFASFCDIPVMPTYHPAYLLRNPDAKKIVWEDMKKIMERLSRERNGLITPPRV